MCVSLNPRQMMTTGDGGKAEDGGGGRDLDMENITVVQIIAA